MAVEWARSKIDECLGHAACKPFQDACLPDRVLDITSIGLAYDIFPDAVVRQHESSEVRKPYAALSHMWGGYQPLRLLKGNISILRSNISWASLPKTFQEAIQFTKKLGIDYIWIDSLCIIHDSAADWREQSGKMASIYENSYVAPAAATAESGLSGCFREPKPFLTGYVTNGSEKVNVENCERIEAMLMTKTDGPSYS